jgi:hypothetical protein
MEERCLVIKMQRQRVSEALSSVQGVVVSSSGPAGIQAETLACAAVGMVLYVLVPKTSDLLFNLEKNPAGCSSAQQLDKARVRRLISANGNLAGFKTMSASERC